MTQSNKKIADFLGKQFVSDVNLARNVETSTPTAFATVNDSGYIET